VPQGLQNIRFALVALRIAEDVVMIDLREDVGATTTLRICALPPDANTEPNGMFS
jgi:hypothetical protein